MSNTQSYVHPHVVNESVMAPLLKLGFLVCICFVQTQALTCIDCADFVINGSFIGDAVSPVLNAIPGIRDKNCRTATYRSNIKTTVCPQNPSTGDKVYKCGAYTGKVVVTAPLNLFEIPVYIIDRECVLVYKGLTNRCHPQNFVQEDAATFQKILDRLDSIGAVSFQGDLCLSDDSTSSALSPQINTVLFLVTVIYAGYKTLFLINE